MTSLLVLLLFAPDGANSVEPVGRGAWENLQDPVARRVSSVLAGAPLRRGFVSVVPLYARVPSEAGASNARRVLWLADDNGGKELVENGRAYLRVLNPSDKRVLIPNGAVYLGEQREVHVARDAIIPGNFAALFPARANELTPGTPGEIDAMKCVGLLPPKAAGALLNGHTDFSNKVLRQWWRLFREKGYVALSRRTQVSKLTAKLRNACGPLHTARARTAVGGVFLIAGEPIAAHVFSSHDLFIDALPDLLRSVAVQARWYQLQLGGAPGSFYARLSRASALSDEQARAVAYLRNMTGAKSRWSESYGEGEEMVSRHERERAMGHAVLDHQRRVVHIGYYSLQELWPQQKPNANDPNLPPPPGTPPGPSGSETPPGQVDRKPRPSLSEERQRERRPGPRPPR